MRKTVNWLDNSFKNNNLPNDKQQMTFRGNSGELSAYSSIDEPLLRIIQA